MEGRGTQLPVEALHDEFAREGYLALPSFFDTAQVDDVLRDTERRVYEEPTPRLVVDDLVTGTRGRLAWYGPEVVRRGRYKVCDLYLESPTLRELAFGNGLDLLLGELMGQPPVLCNSLTFERGSGQPLHVDALYMTPRTHGDLIAIWVALEDAGEEAGPLVYVPGSHRIPPYRFSTGGQRSVPEEMGAWHAYIDAEIARRGLEPATFLASKGDVFIWHAQLVHGGARIRQPTATRRSVVFHYYSRRDCDAMGCVSRPVSGAHWMERAHPPVPASGDLEADLRGFEEKRYLELNPDVAAAVAEGQFESGRHHFVTFGHREGRAL